MEEKMEDSKIRIEQVLLSLKQTTEELSERRRKVFDLRNELDINRNLIVKLNKVISLENEIRTYPVNANGSIVLYNKLNEQYDSFSETHFNKITRFISLIEIEEDNYRKNYLLLIRNYSSPKNVEPYRDSVIKSIKLLNRFYELLDILIAETNGDKVKYNKVFNFLEDQGFFLTRIEKESIELLHQINKNLENVFQGIMSLLESQINTQKILKSISLGLEEVNVNLYGIDQNLWSINMNIKEDS